MSDLISPYVYINEQTNEIQNDNVLDLISTMCKLYIKDQEFYHKEFTLENTLDAVEFCTEKYLYLTEVKQTFSLNSSPGAFAQIGHTLDMITVNDELDEFSQITLFYELTIQVDALQEKLGMYTFVLNQILKEENEGNN